MHDHYPKDEEQKLRSQLARFGVNEGGVEQCEWGVEMAERKIKTLSGGQKTRVSFAMITNTNPHILVFDEPTNHLDIGERIWHVWHVETIEALANALNKFKGGVVVVSHDQFFISRVCKELWTIRNQTIVRFNGEFSEYKKLVTQGKICFVCLTKIVHFFAEHSISNTNDNGIPFRKRSWWVAIYGWFG